MSKDKLTKKTKKKKNQFVKQKEKKQAFSSQNDLPSGSPSKENLKTLNLKNLILYTQYYFCDISKR